MEQLEATIQGTVFRNEENGWTVLTVRSGRSEITVVGSLPELSPGEQAVFSGDWIEHRTYGRQFHCVSCELKTPTTLLGIERFLGSGLIHGVGPSTAQLIVEAFGEETLVVLSEHPERLSEVRGIGKKRAIMIAESFREQQSTRRAMVFLQSYGISPALAIRISRHYGDRTPEIVRENPYRLCDDLEGVGFKTADRIGLSLGIPPDSENRIKSAMTYILRDAAAASGHVYLPEAELCSASASLLNVPLTLCQQALRSLLVSGALHSETDENEDGRRVYLPYYRYAEQEVALMIRRLMTAIAPDKYAGVSRAISSFEKRRNITFSPTQRQAIAGALENGVFVITGGPGTGKTTIINCILELLSKDNETVLCAPTGRAAKRMSEATGAEARTIHRLLEYGGEQGAFTRTDDNPLEANCVIADETSMIDLVLMRALLKAIRPGTRLILVGDADQLPSVGPGNVLGDILDSGEVPCVRLTEIYRQSGESQIVVNAHLINSGQMPVLNGKGTDFFFERKTALADAAQSITALVTSRLPGYLHYPEEERLSLSVRNIQVLKFKDLLIETLKENKKLIIGLYLLFIICFISAWILSGTEMESTIGNLPASNATNSGMGSVNVVDLFIHNEWGGIVTYMASVFFAIPAIIVIIYNGINLGFTGQLFNQIIPNGGIRYIAYLIPHGIFEITASVLQSVAGVLLFLFIWRFIKAWRSDQTQGALDAFDKTKKILIQSIVLMIFATILLLIAAPIEAYISVPFSDFIVGH